MSLVGQAIGQVFFANAAEAHRTGKLGTLVEQLYAKLAHIGLPPALILILLGPELFALAFGEQWRQAGELARWMAFWLFLQFVSSPLSAAVFSTTENQHYMLIFQIMMLFLRLVAIGVGALIGNFLLTIILFCLVSSLSYFVLFLLIVYLSNAYIKYILHEVLFSFLYSFLIITPILTVTMLSLNSLICIYAAYLCTVSLFLMRYTMIFKKSL